MAQSQNGWTVVDAGDCDQGPFEGVRFPNGIRRGDVATIARWQLAQYRRTVEPIVAGTCWGWYGKKITGSDTYSNHASGTAWDVNAPQHPMGPPTSSNMSAREIAACRAIVRASEGTLRWGGDFSSRPDPMHWEIDCTPAEAARFARKIRGEEDLVTTQTEFNTLMSNWWNAKLAPGRDTPELVALQVAPWQQEVGRSGMSTHNVLFGEMRAQLAALYAAGPGDVDEQEIVRGLLAVLTPEAIAAALPDSLVQPVADVLAARLANEEG